MRIYTLDEFSDEIKNKIKSYLPDGVDCKNVFVQRSNKMTNIPNCMEPDPAEYAIPLLYLDGFYVRYRDGERMEKILDDIATYIDQHRENFSDDVHPYVRRRKNRKLIVGRLINRIDAEDCGEFEMRPVKTFPGSDIGIVYDLCLPDDVAGGKTSIPITFEMMQSWGLTADILYNLAKTNTPRLRPAKIQKFGDIIRSLGFTEEEILNNEERICIISNTDCNFGAISVIYPGVDAQIRESVGGDYYLMPSSIHQMVAVPQSFDPDVLADIINSANCENFESYCYGEVLGCKPYVYRDGFIYPVECEPVESIPGYPYTKTEDLLV